MAAIAAQTPAKMQQVLHKAQEKNKAVRIILNRKIDNRSKLTGTVSEISDTGFTFTDQKTRNTMQLAYADVPEVKQKGMSKTARFFLRAGSWSVSGLVWDSRWLAHRRVVLTVKGPDSLAVNAWKSTTLRQRSLVSGN